VMSVLSDNSNRHITIQAPAPEKGSKVLPRQRLPISRKRSRRKEHRESLPPQVKRRSRLRALWQLQVWRFPYKLTISSVSLVRFAEKVPLSRGKRLTVVPNGNPDAHSASRLNKGNHIK